MAQKCAFGPPFGLLFGPPFGPFLAIDANAPPPFGPFLAIDANGSPVVPYWSFFCDCFVKWGTNYALADINIRLDGVDNDVPPGCCSLVGLSSGSNPGLLYGADTL